MSKARVCGVANIPNQIHNVASHTHFNFNVLLMGLAPPRCFADRECLGEMSVGKTAFMNRVLNQPIFTNELFPFFEQCKGREVGIRIREQYCIENDTHATIRLIDAPQVGYSVRKAAG
jgi:septin family protein